jgi:hypothetical protein
VSGDTYVGTNRDGGWETLGWTLFVPARKLIMAVIDVIGTTYGVLKDWFDYLINIFPANSSVGLIICQKVFDY